MARMMQGLSFTGMSCNEMASVEIGSLVLIGTMLAILLILRSASLELFSSQSPSPFTFSNW